MTDHRRRELAVPQGLFVYGLFTLFVVSGFAGLIYQSIWSQYLGLILGHAAYAQALVLATFMGGMGLGAILMSRYGRRLGNPVRAYALVEVMIGLAGLVFHELFVQGREFLFSAFLPTLPASLVSPGKWLFALCLIGPQAVLLGMSFPLLCTGVRRELQNRDGWLLGNLYFTNSIGAALGVLCAAFLFVPALGLPGTVQLAGALNLLVGWAAWVLGDRSKHSAPPLAEQQPAAPGRATAQSDLHKGISVVHLLLLVTACSAAASFVYEVVWIRLISLAVGSTLYAFELMLAAFIAGIALGGLWIRRRIDGAPRPWLMLAWLQLLMGMAALLSLAVYSQSFEWVEFLLRGLSRNDQGYLFFHYGTAAAAVAIMVPTAFFAGTTLPLITALCLKAGAGEAAIGRVYAWNTFGSIVGVIVAVHLLIPLAGLKNAMLLAGAVDMAIGLIILAALKARQRSIWVWGGATASGLLCLLLIASLVKLDPHKLGSGVFRSGTATLQDYQPLFYRDGKTASVAVFESATSRIILNNGKVDAAVRVNPEDDPLTDEPTMILAGTLPFAFHPQAKTAAVIGFGSGLTTHALLANPNLERVDTIEIENQMYQGARHFGEAVSRAYQDPRSRIVIDDAKAFFSYNRQLYDIIISEPSNPWMAGIGSLFAEEFYQYVGEQLQDQGMFVQWIQLYEIDDALVGSVLSALLPHFSDYRAWLANDSDLLILAKKQGTFAAPDYAQLLQGELAKEMQRLNISHPEQLQWREYADAKLLRAIAQSLSSRANSYYYPILSLEAPATLFKRSRAVNIQSLSLNNLPLLSGLHLRPPMPADIPAAIPNVYSADAAAVRARRVLTALEAGEWPGSFALTQSERPVYEQMRSFALYCQSLQSDEMALQLRHLAEFSLQVLAYLDSDQMRSLLADDRSPFTQCKSHPVFSRAFAFLREMPRGYPDALSTAGRDYLATAMEHRLLDNMFGEMVYLLTLASLVNDRQQAADFYSQYSYRVRQQSQWTFHHQVLEQYF